ncbi:MAG: hypothetical protein WCK33_02220 [Phycisphaerae bacterium]|jgi:hypothetical protein
MSAHTHESSLGHEVAQEAHTNVLDTGLLMRWFVGILAFVVFLVIVVSIYFRSVASRMRAERVETTVSSKEANAAKAAAEAVLGVNGQPAAYSWSDAKAGTVHIPLDQAMRKVVDQRTGKAGS